MADASWLPDPTGAHELRYWNGMTWTDHVSDQGTANVDPLSTELPPHIRAPLRRARHPVAADQRGAA
jgi:hypothetical protein